MTAVSTETPSSASKAQDGRHAERSMRELQREQGADWLGHDHAQGDRQREFEVAIEREQDHEDQADC